MKLSRRSRLLATLLALISMLFSQLAIAAYACPSMQIAQALESIALFETAAAAAAHHDMPGCEEMNVDVPVVCQSHGQTGHQSLDKPELPNVSPFMASRLVQTLSHADGPYLSMAPPTENLVLTRTTAPPLSIRNCCFRI